MLQKNFHFLKIVYYRRYCNAIFVSLIDYLMEQYVLKIWVLLFSGDPKSIIALNYFTIIKNFC